jgi:putative mRNA 3-end processing factor
MPPLLQTTSDGLYCAAGDFHIDPQRRVPRAIITHAHADHARPGMGSYLTARDGRRVLRSRLGSSAVIDTLEYGESRTINSVRVSLHPAGHVLGSAQVRVEHRGEVWVVSGDYKVEPDPTCAAWEPVRCHTFITECTFGLPVYRWPAQADLLSDIHDWWRRCRDDGRAAMILAYSLGKAQRIVAAVDHAIGPVYCHPAVEELNQEYRASGIALPATYRPEQAPARKNWGGVLIVAPPQMAGSAWAARFGPLSTALASGWTLTRHGRKRQSFDCGFPVSDHADWPGLLHAIDATCAEQVLLTHGRVDPLVRWLTAAGRSARSL